MSTEASTDLKALYLSIEPELARLEEFLEREFRGEDRFIVRLFDHVRQYRGKQIRPALLLMVAKLGRGDISDDQIKIAAVVEMIHTATLVHDDILDDARLRRNVETLHRRWGERVAVLMGDFIYSRAFYLSTQVPGMASVLSNATNLICEGELLQIRSRYEPGISEEEYFELIRKKTAILYAVACELGGRLSGFEASECPQLRRFGLELGMAFQIIDDCIDYAGEEEVVGKSLGTDLHQGKVTLPLIYLLKMLSPDEAAALGEDLGRPLTADAERSIAAEVRERGALRAAQQRAEEFVHSAKAHLGELPLSMREGLEMMADYVLRRRH